MLWLEAIQRCLFILVHNNKFEYPDDKNFNLFRNKNTMGNHLNNKCITEKG